MPCEDAPCCGCCGTNIYGINQDDTVSYWDGEDEHYAPLDHDWLEDDFVDEDEDEDDPYVPDDQDKDRLGWD